MSNFTPLVDKEYEFDGDTIKVTFSRLLRKDMLNVLPAFLSLSKAEEGGEVYTESINEVLNNIADILPGYVKEFSGLNDSKGDPIDIETVVNEMYFMRLCSLIALDVIAESGVPGGNE